MDEQDVVKVVSVVIDRRLFSVLPGRTHSSFPNLYKPLLELERKQNDDVD